MDSNPKVYVSVKVVETPGEYTITIAEVRIKGSGIYPYVFPQADVHVTTISEELSEDYRQLTLSFEDTQATGHRDD